MEKQTGPVINNAFYDELGEEWNDRFDHPIALLRAENRVRTPWVIEELKKRVGSKGCILDVGCGAGLLTNPLAEAGYNATGIDLSASSLEIARKGKASFLLANAYSLPFENQSFDAVAAMDVLEHVEEPERLIAEASRVLKPKGLFFFHTFNRNWLSYLLIIKGVEWFVQNAPKNMHVYPLFLKPKEVENMCLRYGLKGVDWRGLEPKIFSWGMWKLLTTRSVSQDFTFYFSKSLKTGYCGIAIKNATT